MVANLLLWTGVALEIGTLLGLAWHRRWQRLLSLPLLLVSVAVATVVPVLWPASRQWPFWLWREFIHAGIALAMGLELALLVFLRMPEAQRPARRWIALVLLGLPLILLTSPSGPLMTTLLPRLVIALVWLYGGLAWVALRHAVPVDPLHRTVLLGFGAYMLVYALSWGFTGTDTRVANLSAPLAFNLMMLALLWAAWRDDRVADVDARTVESIWPWRRGERPPRRGAGDDTRRAAAGATGGVGPAWRGAFTPSALGATAAVPAR